jgi:hypothetical protein
MESEMAKEPRSLRSKKLRAALLIYANGKCQICGCDLGKDWHADHIIPWCVTKRTNVHEMQALCPNCNLKKGSTMAGWLLENIDDTAHRPGHVNVNKAYVEWIKAGCPSGCFSIYMCCRYGKSDTIRNLAILSLQHRIASAALVVHPGTTLAKQFLDAQRLKGWRQRWLPAGPNLASVATLTDFAVQSMCNGEWIGSIHAQALAQSHQMELALQWVEKCKAKTGLSPVVFFDESHQFSKDNCWGDIARKFHNAKCPVVVLTATPFRNDKDDVFGFQKKAVDGSFVSKDIIYIQPSTVEGKVEKHTVSRDEQEFLISANCEIPFAQGWAERCIAKCTFDLIDWNMEGWGEGCQGEKRMLSELSQKEARQELPALYRDRNAIREAATRAIRHMKSFREGSVHDATIVWYGMNDESSSGVGSENQKAIKDALLEVDGNLKVAIATQTQDNESDEKSDQTILKFVDTTKKHYDALVLKQMGAAGLDSDRICVVVLWNTVRSLGQMIQMAMRGGNAGVKNHFVIVALADSMTKNRLQSFVDGEGGKYIESIETDHKMELIDKPDKKESGYIPVSVADAGMSDSDGEVASFEDVKLACAVIKVWPDIILRRTIPKIASQARKLGMSSMDFNDDIVFQDTGIDIPQLADNLNERVKQIGKLRFRNEHGRKGDGSPSDNAEHGKLYAEVSRDIKKRAGVFTSWDQKKKDRSLDRNDYMKWTRAADSIFEESRSAIHS